MDMYNTPELLEVGAVEEMVLGTKNIQESDGALDKPQSLASMSVLDVD
jgi:hypothetical protein